MDASQIEEMEAALDTCNTLVGAWTSGGYPQRKTLAGVLRMRVLIEDLLREGRPIKNSTDYDPQLSEN